MKESTYQRKNGSQHSRNTPIIIPSVLAALCSARHPLAGLMDPSNLIARLRNVNNHVCGRMFLLSINKCDEFNRIESKRMR